MPPLPAKCWRDCKMADGRTAFRTLFLVISALSLGYAPINWIIGEEREEQRRRGAKMLTEDPVATP